MCVRVSVISEIEGTGGRSATLVYYINTRTPYVCVCVSVISEMSGTGGCSTTLLAPTWRASLGELQRLLLELTQRLV